MYLTFLLGKWREILIVLLGATAFYYNMQSHRYEDKLDLKTEQLTTCSESLKNALARIELIDTATAEADAAHRESEAKRLAIISALSNQVNNIRKQEPPKDCQKAVEWAIQNKGDLSWPAKQ